MKTTNMRGIISIFLTALPLQAPSITAFHHTAVNVRSLLPKYSAAITATSAFYQATNDDFYDASSAGRVGGGGQAGRLDIPVIGPLFNAPPMLIGATHWLDPPTPLQWKTIEVCLDALARQSDNAGRTMATIDAAPLVAVLQEGSELASIAAIVGYQSISGPEFGVKGIDTFDSASLRESLGGLSSTPFYTESVKVRLLCIGRAKLSGFIAKEFNIDREGSLLEGWEPASATSSSTTNYDQLATSTTSADGWQSSGAIAHITPPNESDMNTDESVSRRASSSATTTSEPVIMARMDLVFDSTAVRNSKQHSTSEFGTHSSPVHALGQLSTWAARISFLHEDRQKLVQGIRAAQTRLDTISKDWQDWDGIGTLNGSIDPKENGESSSLVNRDIEFQSSIDSMLRMTSSPTDCSLLHPLATSKFLSPAAARLINLDNYGLGSTPSAYCNIHAMTKVLMELLEPYYSPEMVQMEEFEYSLFSWVAVQSTIEFLRGQHDYYQQALVATSAIDRMERVYHTMAEHKEALKELAVAKMNELHDCGEECNFY